MKVAPRGTQVFPDISRLDEPARVLPLEIRAPTPDARCVESTLASLETAITPTERFFIRSHFAVPEIDIDGWGLSIEGAIRKPLALSHAEIRNRRHAELECLLECAGNSRASVRPRAEGVLWGNGAVGTARWSGIRLRELLEEAGVDDGSREVLFEGSDGGREPGVDGSLGFAMSLPIEKALDPDTLLADGMNGEPLAPSHGFPLRAIVPGWYGMASVKWLRRITVLKRPFSGYYQTRAYVYIPEGDSADAPKVPATRIRVKSLITWPREGQILSPGEHTIRGIAWSGSGLIERVEVNLGMGSDTPAKADWGPAEFTSPTSRYSWTHWTRKAWIDRPGFYVFRVRATDVEGNIQPDQAAWNFRGIGTNSIHSVPIEVRPGDPSSEH